MAMALMNIVCVLVILSLSLVHRTSGIDAEQDLELESLLRIHNKVKPMKTIKTKLGDTYNCIDIQKQPTLDHPRLRSHIVQRKPTFSPKMENNTTSSRGKYSPVKMVTVDCPEGTVPIRKLSKEDLIRIKSFLESSYSKFQPQSPTEPGQHYAYLSSQDDSKYYGLESVITLHNLQVGNNQSTSARLVIENINNFFVDSLQTGWMISPQLNGDGLTRLFALYEARGPSGRPRSCFNTLCAFGFIQVDKNHPVDMPLLSGLTGSYAIRLRILQDKETDHWWLQFHNDPEHPDSNNYKSIGYWPKDLASQLYDGSTRFVFGGYATAFEDNAPPMGDGKAFNGDDYYLYKGRSYFERLKLYDGSRVSLDPNPDQVEAYTDSPNCYGVKNYGMDKGEYFFLYSGQGGSNCGP